MPQVEKELKVPWAVPITTRDGTLTKDSKMVNAFAEIEPTGGKTIVKRPGSTYVTTQTGTPQGQLDESFIGVGTRIGFYIVNDTLYSYDGAPMHHAKVVHHVKHTIQQNNPRNCIAGIVDVSNGCNRRHLPIVDKQLRRIGNQCRILQQPIVLRRVVVR